MSKNHSIKCSSLIFLSFFFSSRVNNVLATKATTVLSPREAKVDLLTIIAPGASPLTLENTKKRSQPEFHHCQERRRRMVRQKSISVYFFFSAPHFFKPAGTSNKWRGDKETSIKTHDLSSLLKGDFKYCCVNEIRGQLSGLHLCLWT